MANFATKIDITDVFPEFPAYGKSISIRNLLNHTSGLLDYEDLMAQTPAGTPEEKLSQIKDAGVLEILERQKTTKFPPGTKWDYSNSGYAVLAMVVGKVSGEPFGDFLHDRIFAPLKMNATVAYEKGKNKVSNRAYGHSHQGGAWRQVDQSSTSAVLGDGSVYSSLDDLAKWDRALAQHTLLKCRGNEARHHSSESPGWQRAGTRRHPRGIRLWLVPAIRTRDIRACGTTVKPSAFAPRFSASWTISSPLSCSAIAMTWFRRTLRLRSPTFFFAARH